MNAQAKVAALNSIIGIMIKSLPPEAIPQVLLGVQSARQYFETTSLAQPIRDSDINDLLSELTRVEQEIELSRQQQS